MLLSSLLLLVPLQLSLAIRAAPIEQATQVVLPYSGETDPLPLQRQTLDEAVQSARKLVLTHPTGTIATTFPESRPDGLAGSPFALMEYVATDPDEPSSLLLVLLPISTTTRNLQADPRAAFTVHNDEGRANQERVSLIGNVTALDSPSPAESARLSAHYLKFHPDAASWLPGTSNSPHTSYWARLVPESVYYVGGFGDTKYIGWLPVEEWKKEL